VTLSVVGTLGPRGTYIAYEWVFAADLEQQVTETSPGHPEGLKCWFRSEDFVSAACREAGFHLVEVEPFDIPINLPMPEITGTDADLITYTKRRADHEPAPHVSRISYQPWAHITARLS
jgi:hypothetical protein